MDYKAIINLMKEMNQTDLTKLEIESDGVRICIEKEQKQAAIAQGLAPMINLPQPVPPSAIRAPFAAATGVIDQAPTEAGQSQKAISVTAQAAVPAVGEASGIRRLVSPMVGTFYAQASPEKPSFVKVGDKVKKGQTICIIEAMKLLNEIESEYDGEIVEVLVKNEEMVEFGQPLFLIR